jgi:hypothetical protein
MPGDLHYNLIFNCWLDGNLKAAGPIPQLTWIGYFVGMKSKDGIFSMHPRNIAIDMGGGTIEQQIWDAIMQFIEAPDPTSHHQADELAYVPANYHAACLLGCRAVREDTFTWFIVKHFYYEHLWSVRARKLAEAENSKRYYDSHKQAKMGDMGESSSVIISPHHVSSVSHVPLPLPLPLPNKQTKEAFSAQKPRSHFTKPTPNDVQSYAKSLNFTLDGANFCDFYESKGWLVGKTPMKSWQAAVRTWKRRAVESSSPRPDAKCRRCGEPADFSSADNAGILVPWCKTCQPRLWELKNGK